MAKVYIYHSQNFADSMMYGKASTIWNEFIAVKAYIEGKYDFAGELEIPLFGPGVTEVEACLEHAYMRSQNIDSHWNKASPCRSTSVGDIIKIEDDLYIVGSVGFDKIS